VDEGLSATGKDQSELEDGEIPDYINNFREDPDIPARRSYHLGEMYEDEGLEAGLMPSILGLFSEQSREAFHLHDFTSHDPQVRRNFVAAPQRPYGPSNIRHPAYGSYRGFTLWLFCI
jgi:hypothetical protein